MAVLEPLETAVESRQRRTCSWCVSDVKRPSSSPRSQATGHGVVEAQAPVALAKLFMRVLWKKMLVVVHRLFESLAMMKSKPPKQEEVVFLQDHAGRNKLHSKNKAKTNREFLESFEISLSEI